MKAFFRSKPNRKMRQDHNRQHARTLRRIGRSKCPGIKSVYGGVFLFAVFVLCIQEIGLSHRSANIHVKKRFLMKKAETEFQDYDNSLSTKTFHMVCLTHRTFRYKYKDNLSKTIWHAKTWNYTFFDRRCFHRQKDITVYVDNTTYFKSKDYKLDFRLNFKTKSDLPKDYDICKETAYFLGSTGPSEPNNFYHFVRQIYFPLYWLMKSTNQLHPLAQNVVYYPAPYAMCERDKRIVYHDPDKFKPFRDILHIKNKLELSAFVDKPDPHKVCYKNAVFSRELFFQQAKESIEHFKNTLNLQQDVCKPKTVTIVNRASYRKILNVEKLKKIGEELGYNTTEVFMEKLTIKEQAQLIHCTNVLVGVHGAALQWAYFMKDNSSMFEIAWPEKDWPYMYSVSSGPFMTGQVGVVRPLKFAQLKAKCVYNLKATNLYTRDLFKIVTNFTEQQSREIYADPRNYDFLHNPVFSVGKLCDTVVDEEGFRKALLAHS